jgi:hypothetical protein
MLPLQWSANCGERREIRGVRNRAPYAIILVSEKTPERFGYPGKSAMSFLRANTTAEIRLGTSGFTAYGWPVSFYPEGMRPPDYLSHYSKKFDTLEIDSTFY